MEKKTRIQFLRGRWLPDTVELAMPKRLNEKGFNFSWDNWLDRKGKFVQDPGAKVIFSFGYGPSNHFTSRPKQLGKIKIPFIHHVWDLPEFRFYDSWFFGFHKNYAKILKLGFRILTWSRFVQGQLMRIFNLDSELLFEFFNDELVDSVPEQEKKDQIVTVSSFAPHKNFETVIKAVGLLKNKPKYMMIGGGDERTLDEYRKLCEDLRVPYSFPYGCRRVPSHEEAIKRIKESRLMVNMSYFEGLSLTPKEAIWAGVPVIAADIPVMREYHKDTIPLVSSHDHRTLAYRIQEVLDKGMDVERAKKQLGYLTVEKATERAEKWLLDLEI